MRLPEGISGPFFFWVRTDATNVIDEFAFELNNSNFDAQPTTVNLTPPPDLEVVSVNLPATGQAGHGFTFTYTGTNAGASRTPNSSWTDEFYLSSDNQLGAGDTLLSSRFIAFPGSPFAGIPSGLEVDGVCSSTVAVTLPNGLSGPFFVIVAVDRANAVFELDNVNNLELCALSIAIIPPDVRVSAISGRRRRRSRRCAHSRVDRDQRRCRRHDCRCLGGPGDRFGQRRRRRWR